MKEDLLVYYRQEKNLKQKYVLIKDVNTLIMIIPYIMQENIFVDYIYNLSGKKKSLYFIWKISLKLLVNEELSTLHKKSLSCFDDKVYMPNNEYDGLAFGF